MLILKVVIVNNRVLKCIKSLPLFFWASSEPLGRADRAAVTRSLAQTNPESSLGEGAIRMCFERMLMV
jgi:hypothetical protein